LQYFLHKKQSRPSHFSSRYSLGESPFIRVKNYASYELGGFSEEAKRRYRDEHWEADLQKAFDAGRSMAEAILEE